jgi:RNA polymerase sigma-70 factor (ECF subfamily)
LAGNGTDRDRDVMPKFPAWLKLSGRGDGGDPSSDEAAMRLVQRHGDPAAFARLVARWEGPVRRLCARMTGDAHAGEDLAQEAFARVFASRQQFDAARTFSTWLWRIALNLCHEHARRRAVRDEFIPTDDRPSEPGPDERAAESERAALVRGALARLPESHRAVVVLREYQRLKFREIAEVLNAPEGTVKWRMSEAMTQLAGELRPALGDDLDETTAASSARRETQAPPDPESPRTPPAPLGQPKVSVVL